MDTVANPPVSPPLPICPACHAGSGRARSVHARGEQLTVRYHCDGCLHIWHETVKVKGLFDHETAHRC